MKHILFLILFFATINSWGQAKPIYFSGIGGNMVTTNKDSAIYYGVFGKVSTDSVWTLKIFDLNNNLMQIGFYTDSLLTVPQGRFQYYGSVNHFNNQNDENFYLKNTDRFLAEQGQYINGEKTGRWIMFFPDGKIFSITNYIEGIKHGEFKVFNRRGKVVTSGNYQLGLKNGEWTYDTGKKEVYVNDILTSRQGN